MWRDRCRMSFKESEGQMQSCDRNLPVTVTEGFQFLISFKYTGHQDTYVRSQGGKAEDSIFVQKRP